MTPRTVQASETLDSMSPIVIPVSEMEFRFDRAGGPGGQNVNKVNSKAVLHWNVFLSKVLSPQQKDLLQQKLTLSDNGDIVIHARRERSQLQNKNRAIELLHELINEALFVERERIATRIPRAAKRRRLDDKAHNATTKRLRGSVDHRD
ncbi:aminoacyl-tRNA hydrolase [Patescibacteria group bacterium]|nr:aminoacyl-tRNA hydrolase [Patescibacteria group bacterium]